MKTDSNERFDKSPNKVLRHCMVVHAYYPLGETRVERQALTLVDNNVEVDIICLKQPNETVEAVIDRVRVHRLPVGRQRKRGFILQFFEYLTFFLLAFFQLTKLHFQKRFDVIQVHNLPDFLVFVALIPKLTGAKVILDLHDLMPEFYSERFQKPMESLPVRMIRWQERLSCRFADHVITVTELWRQALVERGQPPEKVSVVMNVADERFFHKNNSDGNHDDQQFHMIYHGIMGHRHGLDLALMALKQVLESEPNITFTLHGGGEGREKLEELVYELGLQEHINISKQFVPTPQLVEIIRTADVGIIPYRNGVFTGGILPTKLMEYAALGIPAIVARTPSVSAYFDNTMVEFFDPGDVDGLAACIRKLHHDRDRLTELSQNITRFNERFNWSVQSANYTKLVKGLAVDHV